jgi:hypothetical protein
VADGGTCDHDDDCQSGACCARVCRNLQTDPDNCGACASACSGNHLATRTCTAGICDGTCASGYADCDADKLINGCEISLLTDASHCGDCATVCRVDQICDNGSCGCLAGESDCDGVCADLESDEQHCGACGTICRIGETCVAGVCQCGQNPRCEARKACIDDVCIDACEAGAGSDKCTADCGTFMGYGCYAGPEGAFCFAGYGQSFCTECDRDADCPSGSRCVARFYGNSVTDLNADCNPAKGVCNSLAGYTCPAAT